MDKVDKGRGDTRGSMMDRDTNNDASDESSRETNRDARDYVNNDASEKDGRDAGKNGNNDASDRGTKANNDASELEILYTNAQSLVNKIEELRVLATVYNPDIVIITETWTNESISNEYLSVSGYDIIERQDRNDTDKGRGGGIIVYVRKILYAWREECGTIFNQCGMIGMKMKNNVLHILAVYRSPNSSKANDDELCSYIEKLNGTYIICGDLNFPDIKWSTGSSGAKGRKFLETITDKFLTQHVDMATHNSGNLLDLILSSEDNLVSDVEDCGKIGKSDHVMIKYKVHMDAMRSGRAKASRNFRRARCDEMRSSMRKDWKNTMAGKNVNETWAVLKESIEASIDEYVPMRKIRQIDAPKWLDVEMKKKIQAKRRAWNEWKRTGRGTERALYAKTERDCKRMIRNKKNAYERMIAKNRKVNPKLYFSYVNSAKKNRGRVGPLKNSDGEFIINPKEQAETMKDFFSSVFTRSDGESPPKAAFNGDCSLNEIAVTEEQVKKLIDGLKENGAPGPDGFPPIVLKILRDEIAVPLTILFQKSLDDGQIPDDWRDANITVIHKKGSRAEPGNYRGVSLTSVLGKLLERIVKNEIDSHIENNNLIKNSQHGFRRGRSTQTNLIEFLNETTKWHDEGSCFDVVFLDFSKAFDVVCHKRLMVKLEAIGIQGEVLKWIKDWTSRRRQRVVIDGSSSEWAEVISSVIQGSVLGGILFDIFIDDIDDVLIRILIKKFADDTKLAKRIKDAEDAQQLQANLDKIFEWAETWKMSFNVKKCKVMHFGKNNIRYGYKMNGCDIERVSEEKDLGVWMEEDMRPSKQCKVAAQNANWALGQLSRAFHFRKASCLVPLYKTFVRPKLEHAVAAWSPWMEGDKEVMEKVQRRMVRMISDKKGETYEERLKSMGLTTLEERRERGDMIETFRTVKGLNRVEKENWFKFRNPENARATRSTVSVTDNEQTEREDVLFMEHVRVDCRKQFFSVRVISKWNAIPDVIKAKKSVNAFKNAYDEWKSTETRRQQQQT